MIRHSEGWNGQKIRLLSCGTGAAYGEELTAGKCVDGEFVFPLDFLHYYKNYDIGIPYDYEEYLKSMGVGE